MTPKQLSIATLRILMHCLENAPYLTSRLFFKSLVFLNIWSSLHYLHEPWLVKIAVNGGMPMSNHKTIISQAWVNPHNVHFVLLVHRI